MKILRTKQDKRKPMLEYKFSKAASHEEIRNINKEVSNRSSSSSKCMHVIHARTLTSRTNFQPSTSIKPPHRTDTPAAMQAFPRNRNFLEYALAMITRNFGYRSSYTIRFFILLELFQGCLMNLCRAVGYLLLLAR